MFKHETRFLSEKRERFFFKKCLKYIPFDKVKWGRSGFLPRMCYRYDDVDAFRALGKTATSIVSRIERRIGSACIGVWCNYYRDGSDYTPEHKDSYESTVAVLSLGGTRHLNTRDDATKELTKHVIDGGDLYFFDKTFNDTHTHSVPKSKSMNEPRISLVFFCSSDHTNVIDLRTEENEELHKHLFYLLNPLLRPTETEK